MINQHHVSAQEKPHTGAGSTVGLQKHATFYCLPRDALGKAVLLQNPRLQLINVVHKLVEGVHVREQFSYGVLDIFLILVNLSWPQDCNLSLDAVSYRVRRLHHRAG